MSPNALTAAEARSGLDRGEVGFQAWLLTVTAILGTLAGITAAERRQAATVVSRAGLGDDAGVA